MTSASFKYQVSICGLDSLHTEGRGYGAWACSALQPGGLCIIGSHGVIAEAGEAREPVRGTQGPVLGWEAGTPRVSLCWVAKGPWPGLRPP